MPMTDRERLLAVLNHQSPDRLPWVPRMNLWYEAHKKAGTLPECYRNCTLREIERDLGMGNPARGGRIHRMRFEGVEVLKRRMGDEDVIEWRTPVGSVFRCRITTPELEAAGLPSRIINYPLKGPADYAVWEYVAEHTYWDPAYEAYLEYDRSIGDEGYPFITAGDVPVHNFLENLTGYENGFLQMADHPQQIEHLLGVMAQVEKERLWPVVVNSPARLIRHGGHFDSQITAPPLYRRYILPYYRELSKLMHAHNQLLVLHADNDTHLLYKLVEESGYDLAECFTTEPMVRTTLKGAREAWGTRVIIWGGIPSVLLTSAVSEDEFERHMDELFRVIAPGDAFILGVGDNVVPDAIFDRVVRVSELVRERGTYPVGA